MSELEFDQFCKHYPLKDCKSINEVGNAQIFKVIKADGLLVAVKKTARLKEDKFAENERHIHRFLGSSRYTTNFYDSCMTNSHVYIAMEYCQWGSLYNFMKDFFPEGLITLQHSDFAEILLEMLQCIEFLHSKGIVHRDIKPDNFLISNRGQIKLCDFGFSSMLEDFENLYCGTADFIAPEIIEEHLLDESKQHRVGNPVDIWAFGISAYELAYIETPWVEKNVPNEAVVAKIGKMLLNSYKYPYFDLPTKDNPSLDCLLQACLTIDPDCRITAEELLKQRPHFLQHFSGNEYLFLVKFFNCA